MSTHPIIARPTTTPAWASRFARALAVLATLLTACGPANQDEGASVRSVQQAVVGDQTLTVSFKVPDGFPIQSMAAVSSGLLKAGDRANTAGLLASTTGKVEVGNDAKVGALTAKTQVLLHDRVKVSGNVRSGGSVVKGAGTVISGTTTTNASIPLKEVKWAATAALASLGPVNLEPGTSLVLLPGTYGNLTVKSGAKLTLETGVYVFNNIQIEPQAKVRIDSAQGPVQVYGKSGLTFRGAVESATVGVPQLLLAYLGTQTAYIEAPFIGILVAPAAEVRFQAAKPKGHKGFFYAKTLQFEPDTILAPVTFDWVSLIGLAGYQTPASNAPSQAMEASPVQVWASTDGAGNDALTQTVQVNKPITFALPETYSVRGGIIANGEVTFTFGQGGQTVTCTYQGGSSTNAPTTPDELNKGRQLEFQSCTDGLDADASRTATSFTLTVDPAAGLPVSVTPPMIRDGYCSEEIELLSAYETHQMVTSFNWNAATKVPDVDGLGRPTLYYAWIYIRNNEDRLALRQLLIHVLSKPLFTEELHELAGRCGTISNPGDGTGTFVPALIPGKTYNKLIDALTSPQVDGDRTAFDAVILRTVPQAARTPQGSVSLERLAESGFRYLNYEANPVRAPHEFELDMGIAAAIAGVVEWVAQAARDVGQWFIGALGDIDKELRGRVPVTIDVNVITQDPAFAPNTLAVRAWGSYGTTPLAAPGLEARIEQWFLDMPIPAMTQGHTNLWGRAELAAVASGSRGSGFCLELSTASAMVTDFVLPSTLCDFRIWDPASAPPGGASLQDFKLGNITGAKGVQMLIDDPRLMGLTQADDLYQWAKAVANFSIPRRAKILSGFYADTFARWDDNPDPKKKKKVMFTPCLGYGNTFSDTVLAGALLGTSGAGAAMLGPVGVGIGSVGVAVFTSTIMSTDIVMPLNSALLTSREVMSHEYGHYLFCSLLQVPQPHAVSYLNWATTTSQSLGLTSPVRYINEAMADYFTGQVTGGHDYGWLNGDNATGFYCLPPSGSAPHCWDENHRSFATNGNANQSIARAATLIHDAFDGQVGSLRFANRPNDGLAWEPVAMGLLALSNNWQNNNDGFLDRVALPGGALVEVAELLAVNLDPAGGGEQINDRKLHDSLNTVMERYGANWCDRCQVLALHSSLLVSETIPELLKTCTVDPLLAGLGPPPVPLGRLEASTCQACPPGQAADASGFCVDTCPPDVVVDAATLTSVPQSFPTTSGSTGDPCSDVFVLRIVNLAALPSDLDGVRTSISISPDTQEICERPYELRQEVWTSGSSATAVQSATGVTPNCPGAGVCLTDCLLLPTFEVGAGSADEVEYRSPIDANTSVVVAANPIIP